MTKNRKKLKKQWNTYLYSPEQFLKFMKEIGAAEIPKEQIERSINILRCAFSLPDQGETAAIAISQEKTAALFYDRVWSPYASFVPQDIHFCGATPTEIELVMDMERFSKNKDLQDNHSYKSFLKEFTESSIFSITWKKEKLVRKTTMKRELSEAHWQHYKLRTIPIYSSTKEQESDFHQGKEQILIAALSNIPLPIEEMLSWDQVKNLRKDETSKMHLRELLYWCNTQMKEKSENFISDHLAITLHNYTNSIKKHGIKTALSVIAGTFSSIGIPTVLTHVSQQPLWLSLIEGISVGTGIIAKVAERHIDTKPNPPPEIAWLFEIQNKFT